MAVSGDEGRGNRVFEAPVDGGPAVRLLDTGSAAPVWSPDGHMIVYAGPNIGGTRRVLAMTPDGKPVRFPEMSVSLKMDGYRFLPDGRSLVLLQGAAPNQAFWLVDIATGERRRLPAVPPGPEIQGFDVTTGGKHVLFDRIRPNADIVLIELTRP